MIKKIILGIWILFFLTGCVKSDINIDYVNQNKATMSIDLLCQEKLLDASNINLDELQNNLTKDQFSTWQIEELTKSINGTKYTGLNLTAPETINQTLLEYLSYQKENNTYEVNFNQEIFNQILNTSELKDIQNNYSLESLQDVGLQINLTIHLPGKIQETSYGKINDDHVTIDLLEFLNQQDILEIKIISDSKKSSPWLINSIIIIALAALLYFGIRKKH